jgi:hypothetical protein
MREQIEYIFRDLCQCTGTLAFMFARSKLNKEKLLQIQKTLKDCLNKLEKVLVKLS